MSNPSGTLIDFKSFELWRGPSALTDEPVVVLASGVGDPSRNPKTGAVVQVYFLQADTPPGEAVRAKATRAICGECIHAPHRDGTCYVNPAYGPQQLWNSWRRGDCPPLHPDFWPGRFGSRFLRLGAYGDPAAAPDHVSLALASAAAGHTGYTHAWRDRPDLRAICMASVSGNAEREEAEAGGWRAFQVVPMDRRILRYLEAIPREVAVCNASIERNQRTTCLACGACAGLASKAKASIAVGAHGRRAAAFVALRRARPAHRPAHVLDPRRLGAFVPRG